MKATLTFNLTDPDERDEFSRMMKATNLCSCLFDFKEYLRKKLKHKDLSDKDYVIIEKIQEDFNELMIDNNINLDEIYK